MYINFCISSVKSFSVEVKTTLIFFCSRKINLFPNVLADDPTQTKKISTSKKKSERNQLCLVRKVRFIFHKKGFHGKEPPNFL